MQLTPFDGRDVLRTTIAVTNAGDGLSDAMKVDPQELHHGDTVYVVLECEVDQVTFKPLNKDDDDLLVRVHRLRAGNATLVDAEVVKPMIDAMAQRIALAKEVEDGVKRLSFSEDEHRAQHELNAHFEGPVDGCPLCDDQLTTPDASDPADPDEDDEATVLRRNHMAGSHRDEAMIGCPICDQEAVDAVVDEG